jgi:hypothetical protein
MSVISDQSDLSDSVSMTSDYDDHEDCPLHDDPRQGLCYSLTYAKTACKYKAKIATPGYLPVCQTHRPTPRKEALRAGKCQATELCGHVCNRLSHHAPPFHLCTKHQNGSSTLPCHLMELPTELRLMIFRYLFPDVIPAEKLRAQGQGVKVAILKVSRQIYQEASSILYGESIFRAVIRPTGIDIQGRTWDRTPTVRNKEDDYSADNLLGRHGTRSIQNLELEIELGLKSTCPRGIGNRGITQEDYQLFAMRDAIRKMSNLLRVPPTSVSSSVLKRLTIKPTIHLFGYGWNSEQAIIALFSVLEPLQRLQVQNPRLEAPTPSRHPWYNSIRASDKPIITNMPTKKAYVKLEKQWLKALKEAWASSSRLEPSFAVQESFRKIEIFTQLIHVQGATTVRNGPPPSSSTLSALFISLASPTKTTTWRRWKRSRKQSSCAGSTQIGNSNVRSRLCQTPSTTCSIERTPWMIWMTMMMHRLPASSTPMHSISKMLSCSKSHIHPVKLTIGLI